MVSDRLDRVADDPFGEARSRAASEGRALGLGLSSYFPLEVFDAFGLAGVRLPPRAMDGYPMADGVLQAFACATVRSCLPVRSPDRALMKTPAKRFTRRILE